MDESSTPTAAHPADRPMDGGLVDMVGAARKGDAVAWGDLVQRFAPLVGAITRQYRLSGADQEDVSQVVWLRLFENLDAVREVRALPGWISTTTRREALRVVVARRRNNPVDPSLMTLEANGSDSAVDHDLLRVERERVVLAGLAELAPEHSRLLILLHSEPRPSYQEISRTLDMAPGSIGPTRARCLNKLRNTEAIRTFAGSEVGPDGFEAA